MTSTYRRKGGVIEGLYNGQVAGELLANYWSIKKSYWSMGSSGLHPVFEGGKTGNKKGNLTKERKCLKKDLTSL